LNQRNAFYKQQDERIMKWTKRLGIIAIVLIGIIAIGLTAVHFVTNYIWMDSLQYGNVFTTILFSKVVLALSGFLLFFICTFITLYWARQNYMSHFSHHQLPKFVSNWKYALLMIVLSSVIVGAFGSSIVQGLGWEPALKFLNRSSFNQVDPYFGMDVSFYIFSLPFFQFVLYVLLNLFIFLFVIQIGIYSVFHMYRLSRKAQIHMSVYILLIGLFLASIHYLGKYNTLLTDQVNIFQKSVVHGLSYTDKIINLPKAYILAGAVIIAAIWLSYTLLRGNIQAAVKPIIFYVVLIIVGQLASVLVQNFIVSPNEFSREKPFLEHNLQYTRAAYDLDKIEHKEHPGDATLDEKMIERNTLTMDNIRLNDSRPLLDIYNQLQTFRTYYQFNDMDIDRYEIDGEYEQVFIGARELSTHDLPEQAQTWVNKNLRYTHGYGVAMSHVNKVTSQGQPEYMLKNIPVDGIIDVSRPQIYFGEEPYPNVIVNTKKDEFDYPTGEENATNRFSEDTGVSLAGINRLLFAIKERSVRMFVSDQLTSESQLLMTRNIKDRVEKIAPFLDYDNDPYIFVRDDGTLSWIIDAYVIADSYPYSEEFNGHDNYIRNSVKVVIDAYTGEVDFYIVDNDDPVLKTYEKIFPTLFSRDIPEDVFAHFRYPVDLFKIQAKMYGTYHMSNLEVFYNREDFWQFPTEKYFNQDIEMDPYYITMKLPENDQEEFILMLPYTPKNRQNMISWMGVRNDGENYGEIFVYRFPKQKNVYGPQQIENRINQDSVISQQLNLWSQGGSEVIRGNLLVIPIEDTVLYVEPIYIESSNESSLPEVKQVIMAYEDHIVMEETFEKSLEKILSFIDPNVEVEDEPVIPDDELELEQPEEQPDQGEGEEQAPILDADDLLKEVGQLFNEYQEEMAEGNWAKAGEIMEEIEKLLQTVR